MVVAGNAGGDREVAFTGQAGTLGVAGNVGGDRDAA